MQTIERGGYTKQEILDALHGKRGAINFKFRYDLLDKNENFIKELDNVEAGEVSLASLSQIKRTARFTIIDDGTINFLSDRIRPVILLKIPGGNWVEFPQGIFLLSSPDRNDQTGQVQRQIEGFDGTIILKEDKFDARYTVTNGTRYYDAVIAILATAGITKYNIENTDKTLTRDIEYEIGTEKIDAINDLLGQINYTPIRVDVNGFFTTSLYRSPSTLPEEYTYRDDELSVTLPGMTENLDIFNIPNKWVVVRSNAEQAPLRSVYTNSSEESPTSTVNRGRTITDFREVDNIADQTALDTYTQRIAFEASQVYGKIRFETSIMPFHDYADVIGVYYSPLGIGEKYAETQWTIPLQAGATMKHEARRVVTI